MSAQSFEDDFLGIIASAAICLMLLLAFMVSVFFIPIAIAIFVLYRIHKQRYNSAEAREERAKAHTQTLYRQACAVTPLFPDKEAFGAAIINQLPEGLPTSVIAICIDVTLALYDREQFSSTVPPPPPICDSVEGQHYRDFLSQYCAREHDPKAGEVAIQTLATSLRALCMAMPHFAEVSDPLYEVRITDLMSRKDLGWCVRDVAVTFFEDEVAAASLFTNLRESIRSNFHTVAGIDPKKRYQEQPEAIPPQDYEGDDVVEAYLGGTPLEWLFEVQVPFGIPDSAFFEHLWALAPPGTGKTQLIQSLVLHHLPKVERDEASIVVMDSQGDLILHIRGLAKFAPGEPLAGKLIVLEPDLEYPLAINPFDIGGDRFDGYSPRRQEQLTNNALELLTYVFGSLLSEGSGDSSGGMTAKQTTLFRFIIRLLMVIPNATLLTFVDILKNGIDAYREHVVQLDPAAQDFFLKQYTDKGFASTKQGLEWRLSMMLENTVFARMFASPKNKLDLYSALNSAHVILINTDKELLGEERTGIFGRFFIAQLLTAAQERASLERSSRLPVYCHIDEAQDYIRSDPKITVVLDQCRKMGLSMFMANQRCAQITSGNVLDALKTTAVKFASTDNYDDAGTLAKAMNSSADFIARQPKQHFALHIRRHTNAAVSVRIPFLVMEKMDRMTKMDQDMVRDDMRSRFARRYIADAETNSQNGGSGYDFDEDKITKQTESDFLQSTDPDIDNPDLTPTEEL